MYIFFNICMFIKITRDTLSVHYLDTNISLQTFLSYIKYL